jgi:hypothetical protein
LIVRANARSDKAPVLREIREEVEELKVLLRLCHDAKGFDDPSTPVGARGASDHALEQLAACIGDCHDSGSVTVNDIITLVDIALGTAQPAACAQGVAPVDVSLIIQAVNNALHGCP